MWTKPRRKSWELSGNPCCPKRINLAVRRRRGLERAAYPLSRLDDPLHHRTSRSPQQECQTFRFCGELKSLLRKRLATEAMPRIPVIFSNINTYGDFIWNRGLLAIPPHHFQSKLW